MNLPMIKIKSKLSRQAYLVQELKKSNSIQMTDSLLNQTILLIRKC